MGISTKSLRQYLQGALSDFSDACDMQPLVTATTLTSLVVKLADLKEEGHTLVPEVYICNDLIETLKPIPYREIIHIGIAHDASSAIAEAIKKCGPLAISNWCIFITKNGADFEYGLFRGSLNPLSISVQETLLSIPIQDNKIVRLCRTATGCVELQNHLGSKQNILLNDKPESEPLPNAYTNELINIICSDIKAESHEPTKTFLGKTLNKALTSCHGTIIAVTSMNKPPSFLKDGVHLKTPLDFPKSVTEKQNIEKQTSTFDFSADHRLTANAALVQGMISSDGITLFSTSGKLLAYNCFIQSTQNKSGKPIVGGARTRAYEALKGKIGKGISAVFIQSQDGWTKFSKE